MTALNWGDLVKDAPESQTGSYEPIPDGDYDLKVIEVSSSTTSTGKTMFKLTTEVQGGAYGKRRVWDNLVISPENKNALGIFFSKMEALGVTREWFQSNNPSNAQVEAAIGGRSFRAQIGSELYNGEKKNRLKRYYVVQASASAVAPSAPAPAPAVASAPPAPPAPPVAEAPVAPSAPADAPF